MDVPEGLKVFTTFTVTKADISLDKRMLHEKIFHTHCERFYNFAYVFCTTFLSISTTSSSSSTLLTSSLLLQTFFCKKKVTSKPESNSSGLYCNCYLRKKREKKKSVGI